MYFKEIKLKNFRNYKELNLDFNKNLNLFLGNNAQGKTNLLESLFVMGLGKSFRTTKDQDMIGFGGDTARAVSLISDEDGDETKIDITYKQDGKIIMLNEAKLSRTVDLLENVYIVVFSPEDLKIVKEGPELRRRFLDRELCQIKPVYYSDLGNYKKVLRQRNILLRERNTDKNLYAVFDEALSDYGIRIVEERKKFTERLLLISKDIHSKVSEGKEELKLEYETKTFSREEYNNLLKESFEKDLHRGFTGVGPHKDDLKIEINNTDIRSYGSQGQQRTAALSMKLAEIGLIKQETGKNAVLLLDDVLSELDRNRQRYLIDAMKDVQVFITATEIDSNVLSLLPKGNTYNINGGNVKILT